MKDFFKNVFANMLGMLLFGIVMSIIGIICVIGIAVSSSTKNDIKDNSVLVLKLDGQMTEQSEDNIMNSIKWSPFPLTLDRIGTFQQEGGDLYWLGCEKCPLLMKLQKELADRLRVAGFNIEFRAYMPHLTIGRQVTSKKIQEPDFPNILYPVTHFSLMESQRIGGKLIYTEIYRCHP